MILVVFEAVAHESRREEYLARAAALAPEVERIDGFLGIERFQSLAAPEKLLSLSAWRDEGAIAQWRAHAMHQEAQARGRTALFQSYRLRIAPVVRDYGKAG